MNQTRKNPFLMHCCSMNQTKKIFFFKLQKYLQNNSRKNSHYKLTKMLNVKLKICSELN